MTEETTYYNQDGVLVTNTRAILGGKTYTMSHITSVQTIRIPANLTGPFIVILLGILLTAGSFLSENMLIPCLTAGIALLILGFVLFRGARSQYAIQISSASGEAKALVSKTQADVQPIVDAITQAIVDRG